jgi:hypothetical protein
MKHCDNAEFRDRIEELAHRLLDRNGVDLFGNLRFDVANLDTLAVIKGNRIYMSYEAKKYPDYILKYILAHELGHLVIKRHTQKFWHVVRHIYPEYEKGKRELLRRVSHSCLS